MTDLERELLYRVAVAVEKLIDARDVHMNDLKPIRQLLAAWNDKPEDL